MLQRKRKKGIIQLISSQTEITPDNDYAYRYFIRKVLGEQWVGVYLPVMRIALAGGGSYTIHIEPLYQNKRIIFLVDCMGKFVFISFKTEEFVKLILYSDYIELWKFRPILTKYALDLFHELENEGSKRYLRKRDFLFDVDFHNSEEYRCRMINILARYTWIKSRKKKVLHQLNKM
jgi:hypothetical protein